MPLRNASKRTLEELVNHDDSNDEDYDDSAPAPSSKSRPSRNRNSNRPSKKIRRASGYRGSDVDEDEDDVLEDDSEPSEEEDDEEVETNHRGRPVRKTAKKVVQYGEDSSDDDLARSSSEEDEGEEGIVKTPKRTSLIVKLKTTTPLAMARNLRPRSGSYSNKLPSSSAPSGARRSTRLSHDEDELLALTNSGRHVEVTRTGSREPDVRPTRGGKGMKHPSKSTIDEEPESPMKYDDDYDDDDNEMEIAPSQQEVLDSVPASQAEPEDLPNLVSDLPLVVHGDFHDEGHETADPLQESEPDRRHEEEEEEEDEEPINRARSTQGPKKRKAESPLEQGRGAVRKRLRAGGRPQRASGRRTQDESSDFDPDNDGENDDQMSSSEGSEASPRKSHKDDYESSNGGRRSTRPRRKAASAQRSSASDEEEELAAEIADLKKDNKKRRSINDEISFEPRGTRRGGKKPNYNLLRNIIPLEEDEEVAAAPSPSARARKPGGGSWQRTLFNVFGPFGGGGNVAPVLGGPAGPRAQGDVDSDSSDDEVMKQPKPVGGAVGMTPTQPSAGTFNPFALQPLNTDPLQTAGTPANLGKVKDKQALADADPLGVDQNVNFDSVGGLQGHIDALKEMVSLPLLYPEIFMRFKITPPRGVLFHGPPGTGKTLLARALASSVSSQGRKVTFYMRKGADALSKWVGEAERQLRLLFEEARKNQPSIIFFDEIDGLAPVRSSKQEQIHASIVSTLLALMDGMDGRGQVIVIGATNRPDSIDPALRRPGRFDREFYFPLPNTEARRAILDIHTRGWNPPLEPAIKDELAELTKGYGGADLRALCTEAALNAVQRRYPQIYKSKEKLEIDPRTIEVTPKDFMISVKKIVPSSERSASSGAAPLPSSIAPLLRRQVGEIERVLAEVLPQKKKLTALEEAQYEDTADAYGFGRERMQQAFESSRVFRPRLLIHGKMGMGQQYVAAALLNHFEGLHVQNFDLQTLLSDSTSSPEATIIRLFSEVKMHKPSVVYISNVLEWYRTVGPTVVSTFFALLRSVKPTDPILVLGLLEEGDDQDELERGFRRELFGYSTRNQYKLEPPAGIERRDFFEPLKEYVRTSPSDFPDPTNRKKRQLEILRIAPPEPEKPPPKPSKDELKAQKKRDHQTLNMLKIRLQPIMDQIRTRHKKFRTGVIDDSQIRYLYEEADPDRVTSDIPPDVIAKAPFRPYEIGFDAHGVPGLVDANEKFYYNLDSVTIEKRLSNGYYKRPKDFLADIKRLAKDARTFGDDDRLLKANELLANVEVDVGGIELTEPLLTAECEKVYQRELAREKEAIEKAKAMNDSQDMPPPQAITNVPHNSSSAPSGSTMSTDGPIILGEPLPTAKDMLGRPAPVTPSRPRAGSSGMTNGVRAIEGPNSHGSGVYNSTDSGNQADAEAESHAEGPESHPSSNQRSNETQKTHTTSSFGNRESAQPRPYHSYTAPSQQLRRETGMSEPLSQTDFMTPMQPGSTAADYANEASTTQTTSGKKNSSGERDQNNTQESGPNLFLLGERRSADGSEIPDTQSDQNSNAAAFSQPSNTNPNPQALVHAASFPGVDPHRSQPQHRTFDGNSSQPRTNGQLVDLLNPEPQSNLIQADEGALDRMIGEISDRTSGMSVEQLEQVNSVLMDVLWKTRGEWNRRRVLENLIDAFNNVTEDMLQVGQDFGRSSWGQITQD